MITKVMALAEGTLCQAATRRFRQILASRKKVALTS